jgi:predicted AlkP superfamily pyrophosphatase or phosphodiesterase
VPRIGEAAADRARCLGGKGIRGAKMHRFLATAAVEAWLLFALRLPLWAQVIHVDHGPNAPIQEAKPYVILVSLDGFRYDYATKYGATALARLAVEGASAPDGMIPSFPSVTFPNHYSIVTGLYPEHHGIVANNFYDPVRKQIYKSRDLETIGDGSWYGGVPLWVLAEKQGMRSACFFWPSSDAEIDGTRPTDYLHYDGKFPNEKRVRQVLAWLSLPPARRPHFITLYFSDTDGAGHEFGPESSQTGDAVYEVDKEIGTLMAGLKALQLPVDVIVLADHGMTAVEGNWIDLDHYADLSGFETVGSSLYPKDESAAARAFQQLKGASDKFVAYRRADVPAYLHYNGNPRIGDPVVIPTGPYMIRAHATENPEIVQPTAKGEHGYDPRQMKDMRAIFFAVGPDVRQGVKVAPFENIDVYPLIAKILGLKIGPIDGHLDGLQEILRRPVRHGQAIRGDNHAVAVNSDTN